jgi:hypothetical protein
MAHAERTRQRVGVSRGKWHYFLNALIEKGLVKMGNFSQNQKKSDCTSLLTPSCLRSKMAITTHFLGRKAAEYATLKCELENISGSQAALDKAAGSIGADANPDLNLASTPVSTAPKVLGKSN